MPSPAPARWPCCCRAPSITCGKSRPPPVAALRTAGVPIAIATDLNPGSSPVHSLLATMNMACVLFGLTPEEALLGVTANAARALGLDDRGAHRARPEGRPRAVGRRAPGRPRLSAGLQSARRRHPQRRARAGHRSHERRPAALRQGEGPHPRHTSAPAPGRRARRVPSENELVESFGISRMTANRALRELTADGYPRARAGRRHLRARKPPARSSLHGAPQHRRGDRPARPSLFRPRHSRKGGRLPTRRWPRSSRTATCSACSTSCIVHEENGVPVQLEDRYVNPAVVPDFLDQDFSQTTPTAVSARRHCRSTSWSTRSRRSLPDARAAAPARHRRAANPASRCTAAPGAAGRSSPSPPSPIPPAATPSTAATDQRRAARSRNRSPP